MSEVEPLPRPEPPPLPPPRILIPDPWPRFVPVLWLMALLLLINVALTIYVQVSGDESPFVDAAGTIAAAIVVLAFALRERRATIGSLRTAHLTGRDWLLTAGSLLVLAAVVEAWFWVAAHVFQFENYLPTFREHGWPTWSAVVLVVVCPAVFEELAFRGFLQERLGALIGRRDAWLLQAMLFAILHMSPVVLPSHITIGLCLGWLRNRTFSLVPGMLVHGGWNLIVLLQEGLLAGW